MNSAYAACARSAWKAASHARARLRIGAEVEPELQAVLWWYAKADEAPVGVNRMAFDVLAEIYGPAQAMAGLLADPPCDTEPAA